MHLIGLNPSSKNLSRESFTVRIIFLSMSFLPEKGSMSEKSFKFIAIAFIVKSRRDKSSSIVEAYFIKSGCRESE